MEETLPDAFESLSRDEKLLRLGILESSTVPRTINRHINNRLEHLAKYVDEETIESIKQNSPRPYPTVRPMDKRARENHAKHGRVFETSMLLFDTKHCDCCGITVPIHDDPQMQKLASSKDHTFRRSPSCDEVS